ncbi:proline-rich protein 36-like [Nothobranchius furzeri]|uniref:proline-rich protein 36-like n=1 Tax=Nothobranchius furzeri TaxID=105023 RepID=UPI003904903B
MVSGERDIPGIHEEPASGPGGERNRPCKQGTQLENLREEIESKRVNALPDQLWSTLVRLHICASACFTIKRLYATFLPVCLSSSRVWILASAPLHSAALPAPVAYPDPPAGFSLSSSSSASPPLASPTISLGDPRRPSGTGREFGWGDAPGSLWFRGHEAGGLFPRSGSMAWGETPDSTTIQCPGTEHASVTSRGGALAAAQLTELVSLPAQKQTAPAKKLTDRAQKLTVQAQKRMDRAQKLTDRAQKLTEPAQKQMVQAQKLTVPARKLTLPAQKQTDRAQKLTELAQKQTVQAQKLTVQAQKLTVQAQKQTVPVPVQKSASMPPRVLKSTPPRDLKRTPPRVLKSTSPLKSTFLLKSTSPLKLTSPLTSTSPLKSTSSLKLTYPLKSTSLPVQGSTPRLKLPLKSSRLKSPLKSSCLKSPLKSSHLKSPSLKLPLKSSHLKLPLKPSLKSSRLKSSLNRGVSSHVPAFGHHRPCPRQARAPKSPSPLPLPQTQAPKSPSSPPLLQTHVSPLIAPTYLSSPNHPSSRPSSCSIIKRLYEMFLPVCLSSSRVWI